MGKGLNLLLLFLFFLLTLSCKKNTSSKKLIIFHAGSLSVPVKRITESFKKGYPDVKILTESCGSRMCARKITDLKKECDIMMSADFEVIDSLLIPEYASFNIPFATNEIGIAYTDKSKYQDQLNEKNWYEIMLRKDVKFGRSNPDFDPCGYRTVLVFKLAEKFYKVPGISQKLINKDKKFIRAKETDLLPLLQGNNIDYLFIYKSVAVQHNLKFLTLPDEINLKSPKFKDFYASVSVKISGKKPGEFIIRKGKPIVYSFTILKNAPHKKEAMDFAKFLLTKDKGLKILKQSGQTPLLNFKTSTFSKIPQELKELITKQ